MKAHYKHLFRKFINDECSREELQQLLDYLALNDGDPETEEVVDEIWSKVHSHSFVRPDNADRVFEQILRKSRYHNQNKGNRFLLFPQYWPKIAASILILLFAGLGLLYLNLFSAMITKSTDFGETMSVTLPDESEVILNGNSSITYPDNWNDQEPREVSVKGEAFFDVKHYEREQKFIVNTTDGVKVEVMGTTFNVNTRRNSTRVVLNSGKIRLDIGGLGEQTTSILMEPGELVAYSGETRNITRKKVNIAQYTSWKDNKLVFEEQTLQSIAEELEDSYGYEVTFENDSIAGLEFTGTVPRDKEEALIEMLGKAFGLKVNKTGKSIRFYKE